MFYEKDVIDLKNEIIELKKENYQIKSENSLLKVKIRKLQAHLKRSEKQIEALLVPAANASAFNSKIITRGTSKVINEKSAEIVLKMKEKIEKLENTLHERDSIIKKLQEQIKMMKIYSSQHLKSSVINNMDKDGKIFKFLNTVIGEHQKRWKEPSSDSLLSPTTVGETNFESASSANIGSSICDNSTNFELNEIKNNKLESIMEEINSQMLRNKNESPQSDLISTDLTEYSHEEIAKLQSQFFDMLLEVNLLKSTIVQLQKQSEKTDTILKEKNISIDDLINEVNELKVNKIRKGSTSARVQRNKILEKIYRPKSYQIKSK